MVPNFTLISTYLHPNWPANASPCCFVTFLSDSRSVLLPTKRNLMFLPFSC
uniref:Uncharacterized protein n=1 Tax=Arcella intermedia TaxID=1963864 RepID=A0A6B2LW24_9EUKA